MKRQVGYICTFYTMTIRLMLPPDLHISHKKLFKTPFCRYPFKTKTRTFEKKADCSMHNI